MSKRAVSTGSVNASASDDNPRKWQQAMQRDADWEKKDLLEVIYWSACKRTMWTVQLRQVLALILGVVFGALPVTGAAGHMLFGSISAAALFLYYTKFLGVDDEDDKFGRWDLLIEGLWSSYALFLITWISVYSLPY